MLTWKNVRENMMKDEAFAEHCRWMQVNADVADALMLFRLSHDLTQKEMAQRCGLPIREIKSLENMDGNPTLNTIKKIAKATGKTARIVFE